MLERSENIQDNEKEQKNQKPSKVLLDTMLSQRLLVMSLTVKMIVLPI